MIKSISELVPGDVFIFPFKDGPATVRFLKSFDSPWSDHTSPDLLALEIQFVKPFLNRVAGPKVYQVPSIHPSKQVEVLDD